MRVETTRASRSINTVLTARTVSALRVKITQRYVTEGICNQESKSTADWIMVTG